MKIDRCFAARSMRGFTLIELMVVVVIVAILAAVALPNYTRYTYRARRIDGQQALLRIATAEERFYAGSNRYGTAAEIGLTATASEKGYYSLSIAQTTVNTIANQGFTATATAQGAQAKDGCTSLILSQTGAKTFAGSTTNGSCW